MNQGKRLVGAIDMSGRKIREGGERVFRIYYIWYEIIKEQKN